MPCTQCMAGNYSRNTFPLTHIIYQDHTAFSPYQDILWDLTHFLALRTWVHLAFRQKLVASSHQKRRPPVFLSFHVFWLFDDSWLLRIKFATYLLYFTLQFGVCRLESTQVRQNMHLLHRTSLQSNSLTWNIDIEYHQVTARMFQFHHCVQIQANHQNIAGGDLTPTLTLCWSETGHILLLVMSFCLIRMLRSCRIGMLLGVLPFILNLTSRCDIQLMVWS